MKMFKNNKLMRKEYKIHYELKNSIDNLLID